MARIIFLVFFVFFFNVNSCTNVDNYHHYEIDTNLPSIVPDAVKIRAKRQTLTDHKNEYQSVAQGSNASAPAITTQQQQQAQTNNGKDASFMVPYNASDRPLLGVNGTGQRKDYDVRPDTIQNNSNASNGMKLSLSSPIETTATDSQEQLIDSVDVPENDTLNAVKEHNYSVNQTTDYHNYYNSTIYVNKAEVDEIWNSMKNMPPNPMLSQSHRRAMTMELSFGFPFYGHRIQNITVATGGFLYTGDYVHSWLAATQYVAPLMANFDTSLSNDSYVRLKDNGTAFTVVWENVSLQDKQDVGKFTFAATLHKNGDIVFTYINVPILVNAIQDDKHPVKVGLSDAYIIDKLVFIARRKTIYEYHRVNFASSEITNATIIYLKALPTCLSYTDCAACVEHSTSFDCAWCPVLNRCSTGTDRRKQEWETKGCERSQITSVDTCPAIGERGNNATQPNTAINANTNTNTTSSNDSNTNTKNNDNNNNNNNNNNDKHNDENHDNDDDIHATHDTETATIQTVKMNEVNSENHFETNKSALAAEHPTEKKNMGLMMAFLVPLCLVMSAILWVFYAYKNPHTKSGQLLIQYRPSQWSWRRGEARYTAATIHM